MRSMSKVSRGRSFSGAVNYCLFDKKHGKEPRGKILFSSGVDTENANTIVHDFSMVSSRKQKIEKPVWHQSLSFPPGEKVSDKKMQKIAQSYMKKMGFSDSHQYIVIRHDDTDHSHMHIIANRIANDKDGTLYLGKNENLKSTQACRELEKECHLRVTKERSRQEKPRIEPSKNELQKAVRTGVKPPRMELQERVDFALFESQDFPSFAKNLAENGVTIHPSMDKKKGVCRGFSFGFNGVFMRGSQLGRAFSFTNIIQSKNWGEFIEQIGKGVIELCAQIAGAGIAFDQNGRIASAGSSIGSRAWQGAQFGKKELPNCAQNRRESKGDSDMFKERKSDKNSVLNCGRGTTTAPAPGLGRGAGLGARQKEVEDMGGVNGRRATLAALGGVMNQRGDKYHHQQEQPGKMEEGLDLAQDAALAGDIGDGLGM